MSEPPDHDLDADQCKRGLEIIAQIRMKQQEQMKKLDVLERYYIERLRQIKGPCPKIAAVRMSPPPRENYRCVLWDGHTTPCQKRKYS